MSRLSKSVRDQVKKRAGDRCEYCRKPNKTSTYGYHVDHIRPFKHGGSNAIDNLVWACFECNVSKGENIASYDLITGKLTPLFNPRSEKWLDHFEMDVEYITGKTPVGRVTIRILEMNHPSQLETRRLLMETKNWD